MKIVLQCRQKPPSRGVGVNDGFSVCGETISWRRKYGSATISDHFGNSEIERFTRQTSGIIPYRVLVGMDVVTREDEEKAAAVALAKAAKAQEALELELLPGEARRCSERVWGEREIAVPVGAWVEGRWGNALPYRHVSAILLFSPRPAAVAS